MSVSKRTRFEVLRRDNHTCRYCGGTAPDVILTVDHVTPVALGGSDDPTNLVAACKDCNAGKTSTSPDAETVADVKADAVRWREAVAEAARRLAESDGWLEYRDAFVSELDLFRSKSPVSNGYAFQLPSDWENTVEIFYKRSLPADRLTRALHIAVNNQRVGFYDVWRYMCGVAWKFVAEIEEVARKILDEEAAADVS